MNIKTKRQYSQNLTFVNYTSSKLEKEWLHILLKYKNNYTSHYCFLIKQFQKRLSILSNDVKKCKKGYLCEGSDLSYFLYKYNNDSYIKQYIEPLFGILRNTFEVCNKGAKGDIISKEYLLPYYIFPFEYPIIYIDAGASTFFKGAGGSSQSFFYYLYNNVSSNIFKEWYLWEAKKQNISKVLNEIPSNLKRIYHYYNYAIDANLTSHNNPLNFIKKLQHNHFIIFKLDVDTPSVELPIFNYLLLHDDIIPNEFYFEYHFYEPYMMQHGWKTKVDKSCSLYCAIKKFIELRKKGIRSHPWV